MIARLCFYVLFLCRSYRKPISELVKTLRRYCCYSCKKYRYLESYRQYLGKDLGESLPSQSNKLNPKANRVYKFAVEITTSQTGFMMLTFTTVIIYDGSDNISHMSLIRPNTLVLTLKLSSFLYQD